MTDPTNPTTPFQPISEKDMAAHLDSFRVKLTAYAKRSYKVSEEVAEDLVGEVIFKAVRYRTKYDPAKGAISTFLYRILKNTYIDSIRTKKAKFHGTMIPNEINHGENTYLHEPVVEADDFSANFDQQLLLKSIALLPEKFSRMMLGLANGKTYEELAEEFGKPLGTVKAQVNRARRILANSLYYSGIIDKHHLGRSEYMLDEDYRKDAITVQHTKDLSKVTPELLGLYRAKKEVKPAPKPEPAVIVCAQSGSPNMNYIKRFFNKG